MRLTKILGGILAAAIGAIIQEQIEKLTEKQANKLKKYVDKEAQKLSQKFIITLKKKEKKALKTTKKLSGHVVQSITNAVESATGKISQIEVPQVGKALKKAKKAVS